MKCRGNGAVVKNLDRKTWSVRLQKSAFRWSAPLGFCGCKMVQVFVRFFVLLGALCALASCARAAYAADWWGEIPECVARGGLPNAIGKLKAGGVVRVAYLGGSITEQKGWRVLSRKLLQKKFPSAEVEEIHAAISGTGSDFGALRLGKEVLDFKPDLLFVEFSVNDQNFSEDYIKKCMESIVRQTWTANPQTDICFVYTVTAWDVDSAKKGARKRTAAIMEEVAEYYNIPSVDFGVGVTDLCKRGKLVMRDKSCDVEEISGELLGVDTPPALDSRARLVFSLDGTHPFPNTGHILYMRALERSLPLIEAAGAKAPARVIPEAKYAAVDKVECRFIKDFGEKTGKFRDAPLKARVASKQMWHNYKLMGPADTLKFKFSGTMLGLAYELGPKSGSIDVSVDGAEAVNFKLVDAWSYSPRPSGMVLFFGLPRGEHNAVVNVCDKKFDKLKIVRLPNKDEYLSKNPSFLTDYYAPISAFFTDGKFLD